MSNIAHSFPRFSSNKEDPLIVVALSGGVDSAVSAYLLKQAGYRILGLFMKNWDDDAGCTAVHDYEDVLQIASHLGIDCYSVNFTKEYKERVFSQFIKDLKQGITPNPDVLCNQHIKFDVLLNKAKELNADYLATGHYCTKDHHNRLCKGLDPSKDQSYFLSSLTPNILQSVLFPIGHLHKKQVREIAHSINLPVKDKKDSTGICFIGKRKFADFIEPYVGKEKGKFCTPEGQVVGEHEGVWYYTIGQRQGLGIGGPGEAWYVADKDLDTQTVTVVQGSNHNALYSKKLHAIDAAFTSSKPLSFPFSCEAKTRYRQQDQLCTVIQGAKDSIKVVFEKPQWAITPGQYVVFYQKNICLGNAKIIAQNS